jgi:mycothiol synthase
MTPTLTYSNRHYTDADLQAVCDMLNLCDSVDDLDDNFTPEDLRLEFESPNLSKEKDIRLWWDAEERLVGYGQIWLPVEQNEGEIAGYFYWRVHPELRNNGLEEELFGWAETRVGDLAREAGVAACIRSMCPDHYAYGREVMERQAYGVVRYFFKMERDLSEPVPDPQLPEGFTLRHVENDDEAARWVEMFNASFIDHYDFHPMQVESHLHWLKSPKYRPEHDLIAVAPDGTFAAFCFCWVDPENNARNNRKEGWIEILGTRRGYRKIGLGRAMLLAGLKRLKEDDLEKGVLGVDAENPSGALGLYESAGFKTVRTHVAYVKIW